MTVRVEQTVEKVTLVTQVTLTKTLTARVTVVTLVTLTRALAARDA